MNIKPYTLEEIDQELQEVEAKLMGLDGLTQRRSDLINLKLLITRLRTGNQSVAPSDAQPASIPASGKAQPRSTVQLALQVLATSAVPLNTREIIERMVRLGWASSGDKAKDFRRVYVTLLRSSQIAKAGGGKWKAKAAS